MLSSSPLFMVESFPFCGVVRCEFCIVKERVDLLALKQEPAG